MSYYLDTVSQSVDYFYYEKLYASMEVGSNGDVYGDPTYSTGDDQTEGAWGYQVWDTNTSDGFDSGSVSVQFTGFANGNEALIVGENATASYSGDSFSSILSVQLQAAVMIPGSARWDGINVKFYSGNSLVETDNIDAGPSVNTTALSNPVAQQILTVMPSTSQSISKVVVAGTMRLTAPAGSYPSSSDMFCNIFING